MRVRARRQPDLKPVVDELTARANTHDGIEREGTSPFRVAGLRRRSRLRRSQHRPTRRTTFLVRETSKWSNR